MSTQEIYDFLQDHHSRHQTSQPFIVENVVDRTYYTPAIMIDEQTAPMSSDTPSVGTSATPCSFDFSEDLASNTYSDTTAQFSYVYGHQPVPETNTVLRLPCEFHGYRSCRATFDIGDERGWINHIAHVHLNHVFPLHCICWFCSHGDYIAASDSYQGRKQCYVERMHHIAEHFRQGSTIDDVRPDHYFTDHIHSLGLLGTSEYRYLTSYHELPQPDHYYPAGWRPERPERGHLRVEHRSIRRGRMSRPLRVQDYYS